MVWCEWWWCWVISDDVDDRINGKVTFYDDEKGFGFIKNPLNQDSYFFHFSECPDQLAVGDKVEFELIKGEKGMNAVNVRLIN